MLSLTCQFPGCASGGSVERCSNSDGRLACPAHRTLRNGAYVCLMCDHEKEQSASLALVQASEAAQQDFAESRQRWLFLGNLGSAVLGAAFVVVGYNYGQSHPYSSDGTTTMFWGALILCFSAWVLWDAGGFKHKVFDGKSTFKKILYWSGAATGLTIGIVFVIAAFVALAFFSDVSSEGQRAQARAVIRDGVGDAIRDDRGHY